MPNSTAMNPADTTSATRSRPSDDSDTWATVMAASAAVASDAGKVGRTQFRGYLKRRRNDR